MVRYSDTTRGGGPTAEGVRVGEDCIATPGRQPCNPIPLTPKAHRCHGAALPVLTPTTNRSQPQPAERQRTADGQRARTRNGGFLRVGTRSRLSSHARPARRASLPTDTHPRPCPASHPGNGPPGALGRLHAALELPPPHRPGPPPTGE